ncbi:TPM domain-containing protein [Microbacterium sp. ZKA21]|uniref:TPM domain-containing protein n=1 Tax=Microbacterium sp. ZKA21 TaxID=3381694 RepID=UPI003D20BF3C
MRRSTVVGLAAVLSGCLIGGAAAAHAETPLDLDDGHITDVSGVLSDADEARLEQRLGELAAADDRPELFVVLVPDFSDPGNALTWADETALRNNLAPDQYLLAIATDGRSLAISAEYGDGGPEAGPLSEARVLDIEDELGASHLADEDWAGGIDYVADEFDTVPWPWWVWLLGLAGLALIIFLVTQLVLFLRRRAALAAELRTLEGQKKRAARQLVQTDEAVRTSEQELGFVTAEFGEETTAEFAAVLTDCRSRLQEAFQLLEKLQDAEEDSTSETRSWTDTIIRLCREVDSALEGRKRELASLRALADGAAETLARLRSEREAAAAFAGEATDRLASLATAFTAAELAGVADNPDEISARLNAADVQLDALRKAVESRRPKAITPAVHEIERLLAEAKDLRDAVGAEADALAARAGAPTGTSAMDAPAEGAVESPASMLDRAKAAVRAAELSVQARPGQVGSFPLSRLYFAQRQLSEALAAGGTDDAEIRAASALAAAEQVQSLVASPVAAESRRFARSSPSTERTAVMYDPPSSDTSGRSEWKRTYAYEEDEGRGGKAVWGGVGGGAVGLVSSLSIAGDEPGLVVMFVIGGVVLGALSGAFGRGGDGGGSSSGWGGSSRSSSSRSSWGGSSRSSSSRSSGGSRSSGRSGGRRF